MPAAAAHPASALSAAAAAIAASHNDGPVRRIVSILQDKIDCLERQRQCKIKSSGPDEPCEEILLLEFAWDLLKQVMGIAVLSENEAKKQVRKDNAQRKAQDLKLIQNVLAIVNCVNCLANDPDVRADFLSGKSGAPQLRPEDFEAMDDLYLKISPKPATEEGTPTYETRTEEAAKHVLAVIEGDQRTVAGATYARVKDVISEVDQCGYFDRPRIPDTPEPEEPATPVAEEPPEIVEPVPPPIVPVNPPAPVPHAVPAPTFSMLPPRAPPVTLQQIEHAYFAQYQQQPLPPRPLPPVPEVIGPQSFIFLQESELDGAEMSQQQTPRPVSPVASAIPSQTFTNQTFTIPQRFAPELLQNPQIPMTDIPQPVPYPANEVPSGHIPNYPTANAPMMPMPSAHPIPPHLPTPIVNPHPIQQPPQQQRLPSPFRQSGPFNPQQIQSLELPSSPLNGNEPNMEEKRPASPIEREVEIGEWNNVVDNRNDSENRNELEIDEWNPNESSDSGARTNGQSDKYRPRGRGRGGNFRSRGGYQNGRSGYYRNNDGYQGGGGNSNGRNYNGDNYRERNDSGRYENNQGYHDNYRGGRGTNNRGGIHRQNGAGGRGTHRGNPPPRSAGGNRGQYNRKTGNNQFESRQNGFDSNKQSFTN